MDGNYDLLIRNGRLIDPSQDIDGIKDLAIKDGKVAAVAENLPNTHAQEIIDATGKIVTPGLIDLHTHVFKGLHICIDADKLGAKSGVTTMVDAGSAGAANFALFRDYVLPEYKTRIIPFLNIWITGASMISLPGETNFEKVASALKEGKELPRLLAYFDGLRFASSDTAIRVIEENRDLISGVKVWVNCFVAEGNIAPLHRAREVAIAMGLPLLVCTYFGPPWFKDIMPVLGEGDIQTHFLGVFTSLIQEDGNVMPEAVDARERGVIFDVGHGAGSFDFSVARRAIDAGFLPDTISTDMHSECIDGPTYDLPTTMAKFTMLGLSLGDVIRATTTRPAEVLHLQDRIGSLQAGMEADVALFELAEGEFDLIDTQGNHMKATQRLVNVKTIKAGKILD